jgi:hypothetical protein
MDLNKNHRECLLNELTKAKEDHENQTTANNKRKDDHLKEWFEMGIFLAEQRIKLIEQSLINNEIDF